MGSEWLDERARPDLSFAAMLARSHSIQHAEDFQYGVVWRFARAESGADPAPFEPDELRAPEGDGWELNTDFGDDGREVRTPAWSDGSVVMQLLHWRRPCPGMRAPHPKYVLHERVRYDGDPAPD